MAESDHSDSELSGDSSDEPDESAGEPADGNKSEVAAAAESSADVAATEARAAAAKIRPVKPSRKRQRSGAAAKSVDTEAADGFEPSEIDPDALEAGASDADAQDADAAESDKPATGAQSPNYRDRRRAAAPTRQVPVRRGGSTRGVLMAGLAVLAVVAFVGMIVGSVLFATATNRVHDKDRSQQQFVDFAKQMVVNLTTLNPQNVDQMGKQVFDNMSGAALNQMQTNLPGFISAVQKYNYSSTGNIIASAIARDDKNEPMADEKSATVLIVSGYQATSPQDPKDALLNSFRWKVVVTKLNGQLKVTDMQWVT